MVATLDPFIGRYFSQQFVKQKVLMMTEEEIEEMQKQIVYEKENLPDFMQGPTMGGGQEQQGEDPNQYPPENNTEESDDAPESLTPQLDSSLNKSVTKR
jgi:hypothetical protein